MRINHKRKRAYRFGILAEYYVVLRLWLKGYRLLERRYKTRVGEVDIIVRKGELIAFVEVKARWAGGGLETINVKQQKRIHDAAVLFIAKHPEFANYSLRFDAVSVGAWGRMSYIENAWWA